jgi:hypothetical protein
MMATEIEPEEEVSDSLKVFIHDATHKRMPKKIAAFRVIPKISTGTVISQVQGNRYKATPRVTIP